MLKIPILLLLGGLVFPTHGAEETAIVNEFKINVRGQPSLIGEVITQLQKGEKVTVLEQLKNERSKGGEPTNWAKIKLPANTPVWIFSELVKEGAVAANRLNLRAGPGDNYSVIGRLNKGEKVTVIRNMGDWAEIEAPPDAYAFVDASLLAPSEGAGSATAAPTPAVAAAAVPSTPQPTRFPPQAATEQVSPPSVSPPATETRARRPSPQGTPQDALAAPTNPPLVQASVPAPATAGRIPDAPAPVTPATSTPVLPRELPKVAEAPAKKAEPVPGKRIVRREGIIRATKSIQAPTWYELVHSETKRTIDYLHEEKLGVNLKEHKGQKVIVSGEEAVDPRWPNTPILELETLDIAP
ncbi:MAG TPA: SH3 domain-containing protein [Verrucomicrobiae bacterium]|nr:SH3 domain-containing protein [Verrucomicrobiae bacterium]